MSGPSAREVIQRMSRAMADRDFAAAAALVAPDYVEEWPQSGEVIHGLDNFHAILENYPGGPIKGDLDAADTKIIGTDERWVMTPSFSLVRLEGSGEVYTTVLRARYPDGSTWYVVSINQVRNGLIASRTTYFAPEFDAPEWRRQWVERSR